MRGRLKAVWNDGETELTLAELEWIAHTPDHEIICDTWTVDQRATRWLACRVAVS